MILKLYLKAYEDKLVMQVYFIDPRFKYHDGVMRIYKATNFVTLVSGFESSIRFDENNNLYVVLGNVDEEPFVFTELGQYESFEEMKMDLVLALLELRDAPHFRDYFANEENDVFEF